MEFSDLDSLFDFIADSSDKSLKSNVASKVVKTMQETIKTETYDVYTPKSYSRQYYNDGLLDEDNIKIQVTDSGISVESVRYDGNRNVSQVVESGSGYYANAAKVLTDGRPFTEKTRQKLRDSDILKQAMKDGLNQRGIDARLT